MLSFLQCYWSRALEQLFRFLWLLYRAYSLPIFHGVVCLSVCLLPPRVCMLMCVCVLMHMHVEARKFDSRYCYCIRYCFFFFLLLLLLFLFFFSRELKLNWFLWHIVDFSTQKIICCFPSQLFLLIVFEVGSLTESWTHWFSQTGWSESFRVPYSFLTAPGPELQACMAMPALYLVGSNRVQVLRHTQQ